MQRLLEGRLLWYFKRKMSHSHGLGSLQSQVTVSRKKMGSEKIEGFGAHCPQAWTIRPRGTFSNMTDPEEQ